MLIIDSMAVIHGCYYNNPEDITVGVSKFLEDLKNFFTPDLIIFAKEGGRNFRYDIYPEYKAKRSAKTPEFLEQIDKYYQYIEDLCYQTIGMEGYEADDVIGSIVKKYANDDLECLIVSNDKDFGQVLNENVHLLTFNQGYRLLDCAGVASKFGVKSNQIVDYLSIAGDSADNIKGVEGIGAKGAAELLNNYGNIEGVYQNINFLKPKIQEKLMKSREVIDVCRKVVTIVDNLDIEVNGL